MVTNWQTYGIDYDGLLTDIETDNNVVVPGSHSQLTDHQSLLQTLYSLKLKHCEDQPVNKVKVILLYSKLLQLNGLNFFSVVTNCTEH